MKFFFAVWCIVFIYHIGSVPTEKSFLCGPTRSVINSSLLLIFLTILWQWFVDNDPNAPGDLVLYRTIDPNQSDYVRLNGTLVVFQDQDSNGKNGPDWKFIYFRYWKFMQLYCEVVLQFCVGVNLIWNWAEVLACENVHTFFTDWPFGRANCRYLTSLLSHC